MASGEFDLIGQYFTKQAVQRSDVDKGIGDDCAILTMPAGKQLVVTTDTMVSGVHFLPDANPADIAHKLVAVNMSDLASMGAQPAWASLALTLPEYDQDWLAAFSQSLHQQLSHFGVSLIGGDTTRGPLSVGLTAQGFVEHGKALQRSGAKVGDLVFCSGSLGDAMAGLQLLIGSDVIGNNVVGNDVIDSDVTANDVPGREVTGSDQKQSEALSEDDKAFLISRHQRPTARVCMGEAIQDFATSCIDLSDGLSSDLIHVLKASSSANETLAADIHLDALPLSMPLKSYCGQQTQFEYALSGGDDYELLFTIPEEKKTDFLNQVEQLPISVSCIGQIKTQPNNDEQQARINYFYQQKPIQFTLSGWDHFQ